MDQEFTKHTRNILQQSLSKQKAKVSLSAYSFLFSELVQYSLTTSTKDVPFTQRLHLMGFEMGCRILDALTIKDKITTRFTNIVPLLSFISTSVWKYLFNHQAVLMRGKDSHKEYMLNDKEFQATKYISMPKELQYSTCSSFIAGIVDGILSSAKFCRYYCKSDNVPPCYWIVEGIMSIRCVTLILVFGINSFGIFKSLSGFRQIK